ncbi:MULTISPECIES: response regulator [Methylophaga]|jgi:two-component system chemotaxis response regulator CheY|uniref:Alkaline phosphatase synthesis transcriptional regulatory protein PhoP n=1 Tax=Methylophaga muralis TaxID=291169 RepID=A0A1E3GQ40_9GAMM|nr:MULTISPECIES: response regulator [Methylophaga]ODN66055.1 Alkaline phosphatase synthesis transcriptional regulatory protein PhoP [Methylophaga muralis]THF49775.1 MAG: response regulator [Methylophaga nitratireducenticrescens]THK40961.1 response regulator [Methylophaga sp. SB9B]
MTKILVVDDSPSLRQMLQIILQNSGHDVVCAEDGKQAIEIVSEVQFDLILSDFNMPQLTGPEFISRLRQLPQYRFTPVILLTTETDEDKKQLGRDAGASGWLKKPFDPEQLVVTVNSLLN